MLRTVVWLGGLLLLLPDGLAQVYPSTGTAWVLPGSWQDSVIDGKPASAKQLKLWENQHADIVFGSMQDRAMNQSMNAMGYMYAHKFDCRPGKQEAWFSQQAFRSGVDIEDAYLHFAEDTQLLVDKPSSGLDHLLDGQPYHLLLVRDNQYSTARLPIELQADDQLILISSYPFDSFELNTSAIPEISRHAVDGAGAVGHWQPLAVSWHDKTGTDSQLGQFSLDQPWPSVFPRFEGRELNSGEPGLASGLRVWMLELSWAQASQVESLVIAPWLEMTRSEEQLALAIPGWDPANDKNNDGYINESEFASRANSKASARFRHQARLIPAGYLWPGTCWYRVNFLDGAINKLHAQWYQQDWQQQGLAGAYNDDMAKLLGSNQFKVLSGGKIDELPYVAGSEQAEYEYALQLAGFLQQVKSLTGTQWLAANISELNLWHYAPWPPELREVIDVWLREHYLTPAIGLNRLQRYWDNFALASQQDKSLIMPRPKGGEASCHHRALQLGRRISKQAWHCIIYSISPVKPITTVGTRVTGTAAAIPILIIGHSRVLPKTWPTNPLRCWRSISVPPSLHRVMPSGWYLITKEKRPIRRIRPLMVFPSSPQAGIGCSAVVGLVIFLSRVSLLAAIVKAWRFTAGQGSATIPLSLISSQSK